MGKNIINLGKLKQGQGIADADVPSFSSGGKQKDAVYINSNSIGANPKFIPNIGGFNNFNCNLYLFDIL